MTRCSDGKPSPRNGESSLIAAPEGGIFVTLLRSGEGVAALHPVADAHPSRLAGRRRLPSARRCGLLVVTLGLAVAALVALGQVDIGSARAAVAGADGRLLALALVLYAAGQTLSGAMWGVCQRAGGVRGMSLRTTLGLHWISRAACELLPANLGEAVRVGLVRRQPHGASAGCWRIAGGVAGYKAIDAAVTAAAVLAIALVAPLPGPAGGLRWTALIALSAVAAAAVAWRLGALRPLLATLPDRAGRAVRRLSQGAGVLGDTRAAGGAAVLAVAAVVARVLSLAALLAALGAPPQAAALTFAVIVMAGAVPLAPGGAGTREALLVPALVLAHGMSSGAALAVSLAVQAAALSTSLVVGAVALLWLGPRSVLRPMPADLPAVATAAA
jgi:uncharacterized membrane protein YbhN (UPF0104 family)